MNKFIYIISICAFGFMFACDDVVDINLDSSESFLVVDAWLNNRSENQEIILTLTRPYFDQNSAPVIKDAEVAVINTTQNRTLSFSYSENSKSYVWMPTSAGETMGEIGDAFALQIDRKGVSYTSATELFDVPPVDSITFEYNKKNPFITQDYYIAQFWAKDLPGEGNAYWIKTWKNNMYLNRPSEINTAFDAAFPGASFDEVIFIQPIRSLMNPFDEQTSTTDYPPYLPLQRYAIKDNKVTSVNDVRGKLRDEAHIFDNNIYFGDFDPTNPFAFKGDSSALDGTPFFIRNDSLIRNADVARVEIHSLSNEALFFLGRVAEETNVSGGFGALFATPLANVSTNIMASDKSNVVGFFNIASISSLTQEVNSSSIRDEDPD
jgi:hypothetical protein